MYRIKGLIYRDGKKFPIDEVLGPRFALDYADAINIMNEFNITYYCIYLEGVV